MERSGAGCAAIKGNGNKRGIPRSFAQRARRKSSSADGVPDAEISLPLLVRPQLLESGDIMLVEERGIAAIDRKDHPIFNPLMHRLPFHSKERTHVRPCKQFSWSLFFKEAQHGSMHKIPQFPALPFLGKAEALGSERIAVEQTSHQACRGSHILFKWIRIALGVVGNGSKMLSERGFTQVLSCWRCRPLPAGWQAVVDQFIYAGVHARKRVVNDLLMFGYHGSSVPLSHHLSGIRIRQLTVAGMQWAVIPYKRCLKNSAVRWSVYRVPSGILPAEGRVLAGMWQGFPGTVDGDENDMPFSARKDSLYMEQALQTMIEQMVLALDQAIADAQTAEDISYFAFDGELLSQSGNHYIYQFKIRVQWEPEENSRVYVEIDKQAEQKLAARVVSLVGTTLMLSTREPIPAQLLKQVTLN